MIQMYLVEAFFIWWHPSLSITLLVWLQSESNDCKVVGLGLSSTGRIDEYTVVETPVTKRGLWQ